MPRRGSTGKSIGCGAVLLFAPIIGLIAILVLVVTIIFGGAGSVSGWIFGGGAPQNAPNPNQDPGGGATNLWTPTVIPDSCFVTPTPVSVIIQPTAAPVPPTNTPAAPTPTPHTEYLPTPTACPMTFFATPNPNFPPVGAPGSGSFDIRHGTISLARIQQAIAQREVQEGIPSPIAPYAQKFIDFQSQYHIDAAFALAWAVRESSLCSTGISPTAIECYNILWTSGGGCATHNPVTGPDNVSRDFCGYSGWPTAIEAWFRLMAGYYVPNGLSTVPAITYTYFPCSDNGGGNTQTCPIADQYASTIEELVTRWGIEPDAVSNDSTPHGNPFHSQYVVTQPYGCTDFPEFKDQACATSTGGNAPWFHRGNDIVATGDTTVHATIEGTVTFAGFSNDGFGIRVYITQGPYLVIYPHLSRAMVMAGQSVRWGDAIGTEGSTGYSTGDHLHYEIHINGAWVDSTPYLQKP